MSPILGGIAGISVRGFGHFLNVSSPSFFDSIATATPTGTNTVTFSSIPQTYAHLQIRCYVRTTAAVGFGGADTNIRINNDGGANYRFQRMTASTSGDYADTLAVALAVPTPGTSYESTVFCNSIIDIVDYKSANKYKTIRALYGSVTYSTSLGESGQIVTYYSGSTSAITQLDFILSSGNFATGTQFALYGIKGA